MIGMEKSISHIWIKENWLRIDGPGDGFAPTVADRLPFIESF